MIDQFFNVTVGAIVCPMCLPYFKIQNLHYKDAQKKYLLPALFTPFL